MHKLEISWDYQNCVRINIGFLIKHNLQLFKLIRTFYQLKQISSNTSTWFPVRSHFTRHLVNSIYFSTYYSQKSWSTKSTKTYSTFILFTINKYFYYINLNSIFTLFVFMFPLTRKLYMYSYTYSSATSSVHRYSCICASTNISDVAREVSHSTERLNFLIGVARVLCDRTLPISATSPSRVCLT